jgi:branched-chain amino acid transport system ATP-binding protein
VNRVGASEQAGSETGTGLQVCGLSVRYGKREALHGVDLTMAAGEAVAILGHNGAGKSTLLRAIFGLVPPAAGSVLVDGADLTRASTATRVARGMAFSPQEHYVFGDLTVRQNLQLGRFATKDDDLAAERLELVYRLFPLLRERSGTLARRMSGGQQRMLGIGIALLSAPQVLLLDEPSVGLAPTLFDEIVAALRSLVDTVGLSLLLVEQNIKRALSITDRAYVLQSGRVVLCERSDQLAARDDLWRYF